MITDFYMKNPPLEEATLLLFLGGGLFSGRGLGSYEAMA